MSAADGVDRLRPPSVPEELARTGVMAIVRYRGGGDVLAAVGAVAAGGITVVEVTMDTPGAFEAIAAAVERPELVVGGGTVTEVAQVAELAAIGARFIVSPGFDRDVVTAALDRGLDTLPGVTTATEVMAARRAGSRLFKLFPAGALGTRYLSELRGPFAGEAFVPTGGIAVDGIGAWLLAGASAVAIGSDVAGRLAPRDAAEAAILTERAGRAVAAARSARHDRAVRS
ncbi:MAG: bifunctional 4-hydroxy-2-oxoglutarate aldolase/2-dehydro-3-deoxy-phosphogluconate aldolase [Jatrophihabitantaceae bacterium]